MPFSLIMFRRVKNVLEEVYNINRFHSCHPITKVALEFDDTMKMVGEEVGCLFIANFQL